MCLSDLRTAVLVGGEGADQQACKDALWKLEIGKEFKTVKGNGVSGKKIKDELGGRVSFVQLCLGREQQRGQNS